MLQRFKSIIKHYILPYRPLLKNKVEWNKEYSAGKWDYLHNKEDRARYSIIVGYIRDYFKSPVSILDLGCGQGILQQRLDGYYSKYTGIDLSDEAIKMTADREDENTSFLTEDLRNFKPQIKFDCIIFNESLYYIDKPIKTLKRYEAFLNDNGIILISMWDYKERNNKLWKSINSILKKTDGVYVKLDSGNSWFIRFYRKIICLYILLESSIWDFYYFQADLINYI